MCTYGAKGHIQQSWIKDYEPALSELNDIYNYILQINFQLVRTDDITLLKQNWQFLLKFLFNNKSKYINEIMMVCKLILYTRDINYGKGERKLSYMLLFELYKVDADTAVILFEWFVKKLPNKTSIGCWKDVKRFADYINSETKNDNHKFITQIIHISNRYLKIDHEQITQIYDMFKDKPEERIQHYIKNNIELSLVAKWLPRKSKNNKKYDWLFETLADNMFKHYYKMICTDADINNKQWCRAVNKCEMNYRKMLSFVNKHLNVVEILQTSHKTNYIDFTKIPTLAKNRYHNTFLKNKSHPGDILCCSRYKSYIFNDFLNKHTVTTTKQQLYEIVQHIIVNKLWEHSDGDMERLMVDKHWNSKKITIIEMENIAIVDMSQSMNGLPLYNAIALGIYIAEHNTGSFKDRLITFGNRPQYIKFKENMDICDKVRLALSETSNIHSDLYGVMKTMIHTIKNYNLPKYELKNHTVTILSDMQIENNVKINNTNEIIPTNFYLYNTIKTMFKINHIDMPQIILWNLKQHNGFPISVNDMHTYENVLLMSGFNENNLQIFQSKQESTCKSKSKNKSKNKNNGIPEDNPTRKHEEDISSDNILFKLLSNKRYDFVNKEILTNILL